MSQEGEQFSVSEAEINYKSAKGEVAISIKFSDGLLGHYPPRLREALGNVAASFALTIQAMVTDKDLLH